MDIEIQKAALSVITAYIDLSIMLERRKIDKQNQDKILKMKEELEAASKKTDDGIKAAKTNIEYLLCQKESLYEQMVASFAARINFGATMNDNSARIVELCNTSCWGYKI